MRAKLLAARPRGMPAGLEVSVEAPMGGSNQVAIFNGQSYGDTQFPICADNSPFGCEAVRSDVGMVAMVVVGSSGGAYRTVRFRTPCNPFGCLP